MARGDFVDSFLDNLADAFIQRLNERVGLHFKNGKATKAGTRDQRAPSPMKGRRLKMGCRFPRCKNRSLGPRNPFLCEKHLKDPGWPAARKLIEKAAEKTSHTAP